MPLIYGGFNMKAIPTTGCAPTTGGIQIDETAVGGCLKSGWL
nr:hypothetical protein [Nostoc sp. ChiSLP03a]